MALISMDRLAEWASFVEGVDSFFLFRRTYTCQNVFENNFFFFVMLFIAFRGNPTTDWCHHMVRPASSPSLMTNYKKKIAYTNFGVVLSMHRVTTRELLHADFLSDNDVGACIF